MYLLGKDIRNMRGYVGLTQERFANTLGVSVSTLRLWERMVDSTVTGMMRDGFMDWLARALPMKSIPQKFRYTVKKMRKVEMDDHSSLLEEVRSLLGRDASVVKTTHGTYVVEYMNFSAPPPPVGGTPEEALRQFLEYYRGVVIDHEENTDASDTDLP